MLPSALLTLLKFALLAALYLFLARAIRAILLDLYGSRRKPSRPQPKAAPAPQPARSSRKVPREIVVHPPDGTRPEVKPLAGAGLTLGRASRSDVVLQDVYASDEHAQILPDDDGWCVRDLGSTNGTFLNGAKLTRPTPLAAGDQLRLGKTRVEVRR